MPISNCISTRATGADLCWRVKNSTTPRFVETLSDGSYLATIKPSTTNLRREVKEAKVRVIDYQLDNTNGQVETYRLFSTILDPEVCSADALALAYREGWEIESTFDELKTHQRGAKIVLRSKSPELVAQEIWGHLCCHYAIRTLMFEAVSAGDEDPDRVSFVAALRVTRRSLAQVGDFPLSTLNTSNTSGAEPSRCCLVGSTLYVEDGVNPHVIKRKMSKWRVKRVHHRRWPQPTGPPVITVLVLN